MQFLNFVNIHDLLCSTEDDLEKGWKKRVLAHRIELLIGSCLILVIILALSIGLGGKELSFVLSGLFPTIEPL